MKQVKLSVRLNHEIDRVEIYDVYSKEVVFTGRYGANSGIPDGQIAEFLCDHAEFEITDQSEVRKQWFPVTYVSRDGMTKSMSNEEAYALTDEQMIEIASSMGEAYVGSGSYWIDAGSYWIDAEHFGEEVDGDE